MEHRRLAPLSLLVMGAASACLFASDLTELRGHLANRTGEAHKAVGIVIGLVEGSGESFLASGATAPGSGSAPGPDTVFEIGSITKVFTSLVLADMAVRGEVRLDDPVARFLPTTVRMPSRGGRPITLLDLSNQVSGLPRLPGNFKPARLDDPYADYGPAQLFEYLSGATLSRDSGEKYEYSNLGVGLLGLALASKAGVGYEELVRHRVLEPLGMFDTAVTLSGSMTDRLAVGTDATLKPVKNWDFDALAGAGALRSTARDMLRFLTAAMGLRPTPLRKAFDLMREKSRPTGTPDLDIAMGWHVWTRYGTDIVWHNGGTGGYRSFAGFAPGARSGVVVLCNTSFDIDDLGLHALEPRWPVAHFRPPLEAREVTVAEKDLDAAVGDYELGPGSALLISRSGARLALRISGQLVAILAAASPTQFFSRTGDVRVTLVVNGSGAVTGLLLYRDGFESQAKRTGVRTGGGSAGEDLAIWRGFVAAMKAGGPPPDRVRTYYENFKEPMLGFLAQMRAKANWVEWEKTPEVHRVGDHVHFLIPLTFDGQTADYCFTFLAEGSGWFFRHLEAITIRLDKTGPLPTSSFPDVDEKAKAWIREENGWSREVRIFNLVAELKGKPFAFAFFKDGEGYFLSAKTWVPFVEPRQAFVLYACWEQSNLRGNKVTLEKLGPDEAVLRLSTIFFRLYKDTAHLAQQIPFEDYARIFETIWQDRARAAGWDLTIDYVNEPYRGSECRLTFKRPS